MTSLEIREELERRRDFMRARGYVRCNIAACNCNSWHGGHANQRLQEIDDALNEADVSTNGRTILTAITEALAEKDREIERLKSIVQLDHDVHGEDQQTIADLSRKCELLETRTKEIAASMAKDIARELVPGLAKTASDAAVGAVEQVTKGRWWVR